MLIENRIIDGKIVQYDKVQVAIQRYQSFEPPEGYRIAFSGGKDSCVIDDLADKAGVKHHSHYNLTTVDPPELVHFIKRFHPEVNIDRPKESMWQLIVRKRMPPTRICRYCCACLKESAGVGELTVTGVRWAESANRKAKRNLINIGSSVKTATVYNDDNDESRRAVENCFRTKKTLLNPIIDWTDEDVWQYIHKYNLPYCSLYDEGFKRLGCIGCPMASNQREEFDRWPKYKKIYIHAFDRMIAKRLADGMPTEWKNGTECFNWWVNGGCEEPENMPGQIEMVESEG